MTSSIPIDRLNLKVDDKTKFTPATRLPTKGSTMKGRYNKSWLRSKGEYILWFMVLALLIFFVIYFWLPDYFQHETAGVPNGEADNVKIFIVSVLISATLVILLVWFGFI